MATTSAAFPTWGAHKLADNADVYASKRIVVRKWCGIDNLEADSSSVLIRPLSSRSEHSYRN